jgi:glycosyltransferase involved in cell wall biosynthesis
LTPSNFTRRELLQRYNVTPEKVVATHLAADTKSKKQAPYTQAGDTFIMFVGQQSAYKNIVRLAEAHQQLLRKYPDLQLILVGKVDGPAEKNQALFQKKGYKNIIFTGFVSDEQLNWLYANTAAYVFPSFMEGFGLPGLEAMLQGAPVASSDATCLPEVYGDAALYFDPKDTKAIAGSIERILVDSSLRKKLIAVGKIQVSLYSWERTAEQTLEIYTNVLNENN